MINTKSGDGIKRVRIDNRENILIRPYTFFQQEEILQESSRVDTPQQNGIAVRKNRHIYLM